MGNGLHVAPWAAFYDSIFGYLNPAEPFLAADPLLIHTYLLNLLVCSMIPNKKNLSERCLCFHALHCLLIAFNMQIRASSLMHKTKNPMCL